MDESTTPHCGFRGDEQNLHNTYHHHNKDVQNQLTGKPAQPSQFGYTSSSKELGASCMDILTNLSMSKISSPQKQPRNQMAVPVDLALS